MFSDAVYPLPEVLCPGAWTIHALERGGFTVRARRILAAPLDRSRLARAVRAHEMAHVRFSPDDVDLGRLGVQRWTLLAVEDARVNELALRAGLDVIRDLDDSARSSPDPCMDFRAATLLLVAAHGTGGFSRTKAAVAAAGVAGRRACDLAVQAIETLLGSAGPLTFERTVLVARMLDSHLGPEPPGWDALGTVCCDGPTDGKARADTTHAASLAGNQGWGVLRRVEEPPRPIALQRSRSARACRATDEGAILRAPQRLILDGRVFAHRLRRRRGSVLIDASASMAWTGARLRSLLETAPAALVACYEGTGAGWGVIRILARDGWRVAEEAIAPPLRRGGNVVDGPALRWLARQPPPRVWVSDGRITGVGDRSNPRLSEEVAELCARARIVRVADVAAAGTALSA